MRFTHVYVLMSGRDGRLYIGMTNDLRRRFLQHQNGQNISTAKRLPVRLIYYEAHLSKSDALRRERYFKTTKGKVTLRSMIRDCLAEHPCTNPSNQSPTVPVHGRATPCTGAERLVQGIGQPFES